MQPAESDRQHFDRQYFELIETTRWTAAEGLWLLHYHLDRMRRSAEFFRFRCDLARIRSALDAHTAGLDPSIRSRVRLTLAPDGTPSITSSPLAAPPSTSGLPTATLSGHRTDSADIFLRHKTTNRKLYDDEFKRAQAALGCIEVLFMNQRGELTEGSRTNLFVELDGILLTPALGCGLLDGTLRRSLFEQPGAPIRETILKPDDLGRAARIMIGNSVMGLVEIRLI
jgi:para-aminobenzoate synthetase/4-amino-4-deoxychorismate lyase